LKNYLIISFLKNEIRYFVLIFETIVFLSIIYQPNIEKMVKTLYINIQWELNSLLIVNFYMVFMDVFYIVI
jgi:hypothetical protein